jgi:hypothetical protein
MLAERDVTTPVMPHVDLDGEPARLVVPDAGG